MTDENALTYPLQIALHGPGNNRSHGSKEIP